MSNIGMKIRFLASGVPGRGLSLVVGNTAILRCFNISVTTYFVCVLLLKSNFRSIGTNDTLLEPSMVTHDDPYELDLDNAQSGAIKRVRVVGELRSRANEHSSS